MYRSGEGRLWTHQAFVSFVTALLPRVDEVVLFGRLDPEPGTSHYAVPQEGVRFVPLPHYPRVTAVFRQLRVLRRTRRVFTAELDRLDAVWIFGPHPVALALALAARRHGTPLFLGVRQDYAKYIAARLPSRRWTWAIAAAYALDRVFRRLARTAPTVAVGEELAQKYRRGNAQVMSTGFSLVRRSDVVALDEALGRSWDGDIRVLSVGRLDPEKNPLLLVDVLARLRRDDSRWRLTIAGEGSLETVLAERIRALGLEDVVELVGYVAQGEPLRALYRSHHVFLHVALTEGFPQVLFEAEAAGLPFVATDVGGVGAYVRRAGSGLLVPPADAGAAARAVASLSDASTRRILIEHGLRNAATETTEAQLDRIAAFFRAQLEA